MFDIGISEIMVIAVVALIVLGPEKLPKTARTLGHLFGRLQRYVTDVKADINREIAARRAEEAAGAGADRGDRLRVVDVGRGDRDPVERPRRRDRSQCGGRRERRGAAGRGAAPTMPPSPPDAAAHRDAPRQASLPGFDRG